MRGSDDGRDGAREEFLSEAQEIVETLSRDLLLLDQAQKEKREDPDLLNDIFRAVHTLKGLAGMFGVDNLQELTHTLENLLDDLRLGRVVLTQDTLDVLFEGVENIQRILSSTETGQDDVDVSTFARSVDRVTEGTAQSVGSLDEYELGEHVTSVLTEYEEHRLLTNISQGVPLYRLRVAFALASIDTALEDLKARAKPMAELITYLPSMDGSQDDEIELEVLLASNADEDELRGALCGTTGQLSRVARKDNAPDRSAAASGRETHDNAVAAPQGPNDAAAPTEASADRAGADSLSLRSVANSVRVNIHKLDHLMNVVGELAIVRSAVAQITERIRERPELRSLSTELHRIARTFERNLEELQDGILDVRMVPLGQVFDKLARVIRQVARENGKEIRLEVKGAETEVDKLIVEELSDPLMHLIRNAIDHGIEVPHDRVDANKPPQGRLQLIAYQKGNHVLIEVRDDGKGMDPARLLEKAIEKGLVSEEAARDFGREELYKLIFLPGFSTTEKVTDLSGRGVGMDVVKTNIAKLGGIVDVHSVLGEGTTFTITLPITLAIISALVVGVSKNTYAIPLANVQEALMLDAASIRTVEGREVMTLRGGTLPLCRLDRLFRLRGAEEEEDAGNEAKGLKQFVVVSQLGSRRLGMVVDVLLGQQDIVIKSLGKSLASVRGFAGATDLGDQRVALVLDTPQLLEEVLGSVERAKLAEVAS